ncbi:hypothetical protein [Halovivax limisalsi]|uniref:hypothetical protein n=1 Tax=Halovivax limisalsi TaxID=1453760 RepID=UPI001FFC4EF0|nr:hypothetical protein [Halovivax limisalsi]
MGRYEYDGPSPDRSCERCGQELTPKHSVRLVACHEGASSDRYRDVETYVCGDCVAALGMLEFERVEPGSHTGKSAEDRRQRVWSVGG